MPNKLTILTTIVLTAATTAGGAYYVTTNSQARNSPENAPVAVAPQTDSQAVFHVQAQDADKPITIIVKTEVKEQRPIRDHIGHIRDLKQPELRVMPN